MTQRSKKLLDKARSMVAGTPPVMQASTLSVSTHLAVPHHRRLEVADVPAEMPNVDKRYRILFVHATPPAVRFGGLTRRRGMRLGILEGWREQFTAGKDRKLPGPFLAPQPGGPKFPRNPAYLTRAQRRQVWRAALRSRLG